MERMRFLYEMLRIRRIEEAIADRYPEGVMRCPVHLCIGQEATPVGVCSVLEKDDAIFSTHRSHGHYLAKGASLDRMIAEIYGKATGCSRGKGGSMHLVDLEHGFYGSTSIVSGTIPIATGAAFGWKQQGRKKIVVSFFGDAATEEGLFHESANFAVLHSLPVLFVCENNLYSVYTPLKDRQPQREIADLARAYGMPAVQIDGNDVEAVFESTLEAVKRARDGEGPTFLECKTYRWREHCGPNYDNHIGYRTKEECDEWIKLCPVERLKSSLLKTGELTHSGFAEWDSTIGREIEEAFQFAQESPFPDPSEMTEHVFKKTEASR